MTDFREQLDRKHIADLIQALFAKRRPDVETGEYVVRAWVDGIMETEGMTNGKFMDGVQVFARQTARMDLGNLIQTISDVANKKAKELEQQRQHEQWKYDKAHRGEAPRAWKLQNAFLNARNPTEQMREEILDAIREEMRKAGQGTELWKLWNEAGLTWKGVRIND